MSAAPNAKGKKPAWMEIVKPYQQPDHWKSTGQMLNSLLPFFAIWVLMVWSLQVHYALTLALAFVNALFLMRIFIIQHDCGHNSFFASTKLNNFVGNLLGIITLTPYYHWRKSHAKHHAGSGDLEFRGFGDIDTLTVDEYHALPWYRKFVYRFYRNPFVMFVIGPTFVFTVAHRLPTKTLKGEVRERHSVHFTNVALFIIFMLMGNAFGFREAIMLWLPITVFSSTIGVYLFYVQHQFEDTYWRWHDEWEYDKAALQGASYFKLPALLQWFSGNIGFHHVHHLSPLIPNYNLEQAHNENEIFHQVETITIGSSLKTVFLDLWDEQTHKLVSFREARRLMQQRSAQPATG